MKKWLKKLEETLLFLLPIVIFFSFLPIIRLGMNETMNFELSLPLIWLLLFGGISMRKIPHFWRKSSPKGRLLWLALPSFMTLSILWSLNPLRGFLTAGIGWLIVLSIINILQMKLRAKEIEQLLRLHVYTAAFVGAYCFLQGWLNVWGVASEAIGLCAGCTYQTIGFPHPNGFAIEPQFMGNLLIMPALLSLLFVYYDIEKKKGKKQILGDILLTIFIIMSLFITFSRGAIYAFILAVIYLLWYLCGKLHKFYTLWLIPGILFIISTTLLTQGLWAQISPTNESFRHGITRSIEHMSVGLIDFNEDIVADSTFSGYIEESTDIRLSLNESALAAWRKRPLFGAGLGSAGSAIHAQEAGYSSKEIVQNEYLQVLLELGVIGVLIGIIYGGAVFKKARKYVWLKAVLVAYLATWCFFSGLPNALHIYLLPPLLYLLSKRSGYGKI